MVKISKTKHITKKGVVKRNPVTKLTPNQLRELKRAEYRLGNRADWELKNMRKALSMFPILNSPEENQRLKDVKTVLRYRKKR